MEDFTLFLKRNVSKRFVFTTYMLVTAFFMCSGTPLTPIKIWGGVGPGSEGLTMEERLNSRTPSGSCTIDRTASGITEPELVPFVPVNPNGMSVIICPGGGYSQLTYDVEGTDIADWFNGLGITAFVLKYRLPPEGHINFSDVPLEDAQRAIRTIRYNASSWGLLEDRIGIIGFSAGGNVAASLATMYNKEVYSRIDNVDDISARPNFVMLVYALISMESDITHDGARDNLLGGSITQALIDEYSAEKHIDANTPVAFLAHASNDGSVDYENSVRFNTQLGNAGVDSELHIYSSGGHGKGICRLSSSDDLINWTSDCENWINNLNLSTSIEEKNYEDQIEFVSYYKRNTDQIVFKIDNNSSKPFEDITLSLVDITGNEVYKKTYSGGGYQSVKQVEVNSPVNYNGIFISILSYGSKVYTKKLIVNK